MFYVVVSFKLFSCFVLSQDGLELTDLPASASRIPTGIKATATMLSTKMVFLFLMMRISV